MLVFGTPFSPSLQQYLHRYSQTPPVETPTVQPSGGNSLEVGGTDSGDIRKIVWQGALAVWEQNPVFGSGVETFAYSYYQVRPIAHNMVSEWDFLYNKAHNEFLNYLATTGLFGLGTYLILQTAIGILLLKPLFQKKNIPELSEHIYLGLGFVSGVAALHVSNFFGFSTVMVSVLLFLFPAIF